MILPAKYQSTDGWLVKLVPTIELTRLKNEPDTFNLLKKEVCFLNWIRRIRQRIIINLTIFIFYWVTLVTNVRLFIHSPAPYHYSCMSERKPTSIFYWDCHSRCSNLSPLRWLRGESWTMRNVPKWMYSKNCVVCVVYWKSAKRTWWCNLIAKRHKNENRTFHQALDTLANIITEQLFNKRKKKFLQFCNRN